MIIKKVKNSKKNCVYIGNRFLHRFSSVPRTLKIHFGLWTKEMKVVRQKNLPANTLGISSKSMKGFSLPNLTYKTKIDGHNVHIGPVLGLVGFKKGERLTDKRLNEFKDYFSAYNRIKGLLYVCSAGGIDVKNKRIRGYYYKPGGSKTGYRWIPGTFPLPDALYRRAEIAPSTYRVLSRTLGRRLFNGYFRGEHFDKWDLWKWLSSNKRLRKHLPDTARLRNLSSLVAMLDRHGIVYLKPTMDNMSRGIIKVKRVSGQYEFIFPENNKKTKAFTVKRMSSAKASRFVQKLIKTKAYIIQRGINMMKYDRRGIDFRVILQKNEKLQWSCTAIIARFGKKNSIVTNFTSAGYAMNGDEALKKVFHLNNKEVTSKRNEILKVCLEACKVFEKKGGNYADVGLDVMIDTKGNVWILELNILPDHKLPLYAKKKQIYKKQIIRPLLYAKALAGFKE